MKLPKTGLVIASLILIALVGGFAFKSYRIFTSKGPLGSPTSIIINRGADLDDIARLLETEDVVYSAAIFRLGIRAYGVSKKLKAGEFFIPSQSSPKTVMDILVSGKTVVRSLTIPEGLTSEVIVDLINNAPGLKGDLITNIPPNGTLMPETYHYQYGMKRSSLYKRVRDSITRYMNSVWDKRALELPFTTKEEALSLAAIVDKETLLDRERPIVASVYLNRLKIRMRLQADPTVIYAVTDGKLNMGRALTYKDLKYDHPYNTYIKYGIPPGPICNPGKESINAVLNPADTDYIFFVADGTGGHVFTNTYEEHIKKVREWRKIGKKRRATKAKRVTKK